MREAAKLNRAAIYSDVPIPIAHMEEMFDLLYSRAATYIPGLDLPEFLGLDHPNRDPTIGFAAIHKGMLGSYAALSLTLDSLHGSARPILRQVLEWLLLAKHYYVTGDESLLQEWLCGAEIGVGSRILRALEPQVREPLKKLWHDLCTYTHASTHAQQVGLSTPESAEGARLNILWIRMLLECQYHLLNTWVVPRSLKDFVDRTSSEDERNAVAQRSARLRQLFDESRPQLSSAARRMVFAYRKCWTYARR